MNTNEVVEMIDAITEGREYEFKAGSGEVITDRDGISFIPKSDHLFEVDDPRTAREIAAALVAWANRKDGTIDQAARSIIGSIRWAEYKETTTIPEEVIKRQREVYESGSEQKAFQDSSGARGTSSREDWYRRNVGRMTLETKRRNYNDLHKIRKTMSGGSLEWEDVTKAMQILEESINTHKEPDKNV